MNMDIMLIIARILGLLVAIAYLYYLKPFVDSAKAKYEAEKEKVLADLTEKERKELIDCVENAVDAAEQVLGSKVGKQKKEKVLQTVTEKLQLLTHLTLTASEVDDLIESFVYGMNVARGK